MTVKDIRLHRNIISSLLETNNNLLLDGSIDERKILMRRIAGLMSIADVIRLTYNDTSLCFGRLKCSRSCKPAPVKNRPSQRATTSFSCECKAVVKLNYVTGALTFNPHSRTCLSKISYHQVKYLKLQHRKLKITV